MDKPPEVEPLLAAYRAYIRLLEIEVERLGDWHDNKAGQHLDLEAERDRAKERVAFYEKEWGAK